MGSALGTDRKARRRGVALTREDKRAERTLGALASVILLVIGFLVVFVLKEGWPSFANNGFAWFGAQGAVDEQLLAILESPADPDNYVYTIGAWPLIYSTFLTTFGAITFATIFSLLSAIFIVELAPSAIRRLLEPVVRLLAAVPSVVYGLIGILVIVPFVEKNLIPESTKESVRYVIQLNGEGLAVAVLILTIMITPIMIALIVDALRAVPSAWTQGAAALGVNRWRAMWTVSVRAARPAIVAAGVLATARALGEAIMLAMVTGSDGFAPNPFDGLVFFVEPSRPLAATIVQSSESISVGPFRDTIFAFASVLLVSAGVLSFAGWYIRRSLRRYTLAPQ